MNAVILMTRVPVPGRTKTRLIGALTPEQAAAVHHAFLRDIGKQLQACADDATPFIYLGNEGPARIAMASLPEGIEVIHQLHEPLGDRMARVFKDLFARGFESVVLFGADVPQVQAFDIRNALDALKSSDIVFGPTLDGGYYLVGMNRLHAAVFSDDTAWGTEKVYRQSLQRIGLQLSVTEIRKLRDMDEVEDLIALKATDNLGAACPATAQCVEALLERDKWTA